MSSYRKERFLSLAQPNANQGNLLELSEQFKNVLNNGLHGICFSPYEEGQSPGDQLSEAQIRRRMAIIKPYVKWIRSFSCTDGNEMIPAIAHEMGIKTLVGAWLGKDDKKNQKEIEGVIKVAKAGHADIVAVGNEVLYRKDLTDEELLHFIQRVKAEVKDVPVGYVDAYYEFADMPHITEACDVVLANCYPFWEGCPQEYSLLYMKEMFRKATNAGKGKRVIITETGWPDQGTNLRGAIPSVENAMKYFINTQLWSKEENVEIFYFSSFDESWKTSDEGDVGAFWGIWDKDENLKFV